MAPQIVLHCIRHAEGLHNQGSENWTLPDPSLTILGREQCLALGERHFSNPSKLKLVAASPMLRTLQTALLIFKPALEKGQGCFSHILAMPDAQEATGYPCDIGRDLESLRSLVEHEKWPVDLERVDTGWNVKTVRGRYDATRSSIEARARHTRRLLWEMASDTVEGDMGD